MAHTITTLRFTAKLSKGQHRRLDEVLGMCQLLYNTCLESWQKGYTRWLNRPDPNSETLRCSRFDNFKQLTELRDYCKTLSMSEPPNKIPAYLKWHELDVKVGRGVLTRFENTKQNFYDHCKNWKSKGYPRYKSRARYRSVEVVDAKASMLKPPANDGKWWRLQIKGLPQIRFDGKRLLDYEISVESVRVVRLVKTPLRVEVHIILKVPAVEPSTAALNPVGLDAGIKTRFALSDGTTVARRKHDRTKVKQLQRQLSRAKKGSNSRGKKREMVAKEHRRQKESRRDEDHRIISQLVSTYDGFAVEGLRVANMVRNPKLADYIAQQGWADFYTRLKNKAENAGLMYVEVNPAYTSQTCSLCGTRRDPPLKLHERTFVCYLCGFKLDRDMNAAINICVQAFGLKSGGTMFRSNETLPTCGAQQTSTVRLPTQHKTLSGDAVDRTKQYTHTQSG